jgi:hypothetical protein
MSFSITEIHLAALGWRCKNLSVEFPTGDMRVNNDGKPVASMMAGANHYHLRIHV